MERMVTEELERICFYDMEGSLDKVVRFLQEIKEKYPDKKVHLHLVDRRYDDGQEWFQEVYAVKYTRPENEQEIQKQQADEERSKEYRRQQFESLKKEFGQ